MRKYAAVSIAFILVSLLQNVVRAQSLDGTYYQMYRFFDLAEDRPEIDQRLVASIRTQVRSIQDITSRFKPDQITRDYIQSLAFDAQLLNEALKPGSQSEQKFILESVRDDLELKIRFESAVSGAKDTFRGKIAVSVKTKTGATERAGLVVAANPRRWPNATPMFPLGVSSPARGSMPPGIYQFIATTADGKLVAKQDFSIGLNGQDSDDLEMAIPAAP
jgi:hypothetical protein